MKPESKTVGGGVLQARRLDRYNEMRDFDLTDEPSGKVKRSDSGKSFVIQKHAATALHYDFRLELDGVLLSWAVPKGPSLDPADKRLAVETEDHPVDYRDFEGEIPHGEYGGGPVIVWDRGTWQPIGDPREGMKRGRLEFVLHGEKCRGKFMLVRTRQVGKKQQWLLIKRTDEHVRHGKDAMLPAIRPESVLTGRTIEDIVEGKPAGPKAKMPTKVKVQLAQLVDDVPTKGEWVYELKYDGYRAIAYLDHGKVRLESRNGNEFSYPTIERALSRVRAKTAVFDGEIAHVLPDGRTDFQLLGSDPKAIVYFVFDLLHYDGVDLTGLTLRERKDKLRTILAGEGPPLKFSDHHEGNGHPFFREACRLGLEGIIAKRADRPYKAGRSPEWVKVKCQKRQELVIVGFTPPKGKRKGIGALLLGVKDEARGKGLHYAGKVGTGFTNATLDDLTKKLGKLVVDEPPVVNAPRMKAATWVKPELVGQVRFTEWTRDGALRHPAFEGLRVDKKASAVKREVESPMIGSVAITHPERVVEPKSGLTKADLARYIEATAHYVMPYAQKRPLMFFRCPEGGIGEKPCFVQKHSGRGLKKNVEKGDVEGEEVLYVTKAEGLFELVQFNVVELHGWGCRMPRWDRPDWAIFDFDPDEGLGWKEVVDASLEMKDALAKLGLVSFVKTTGGKGLHVVVPLAPKHDWETVRRFTEGMANMFVRNAPDRFVATMSKKARRGKIFVDYLRNGQGATAVLPYSPRARQGLTVAMPVEWKDLRKIDPKDFDITTVPDLLEKRKVDPWADLLDTKQTLSKAVLKAIGSE
jgi:bifunctional non-homologous end joining protein LigD